MASLWDNIFRASPTAGKQALLQQVPMFAGLDRRQLGEVEKILYHRSYDAGEVIFRQGDPGVGMYVIERGRVEILHAPTERVLADLRDGDFFGEIALLNETPRSARATAIEPTTLYGLFQPELYDLVERLPRLGVKLLLPLAQSLGARLIHADEEREQTYGALERTRAELRRLQGEAASSDGIPGDADATLG
jgi:CRP-like cAMP-binding protein